MRFHFFLILLVLPFEVLISQTHDQEHEHHDHMHKYEFGGAVGPAYDAGEKKITGSLHIHMIRNFGHESRIGTGLGFETIFDEHRHLNFSIPVNLNTGIGLVFTVSPGMLLKKEDGWEKQASIHLECLYEFTFEHFHMGPMFEFAYAASDIHLMLGCHIALGWGE